MDHVSEVISRAFHDSEIAKRFSCRRTKSAAIAYNVLGNNFGKKKKMLAELRRRLEKKKLRVAQYFPSLSTRAKYKKKNMQSPQTIFLCMVDLKGDIAQDLFDSLTCALSERNLNIANLI